MATAFSRTLRSLTVDDARPVLLGIVALSLLLSGWVAWGLLARIAVYAVTPTARLEVDQAVHPVAAPVAGRVVATRLVVGQEVQAGDVLVELDADAQRLQGEEERARLAALTAQLQVYAEELSAEDATWHAEQQAAQAAMDEARARQREAEVIARAAYEEAEVVILLPAPEFADQLEVIRSRAEVPRRQAAVDTLHLAAKRLEEEQQVRARDRQARRARLRRAVVRLEGERATVAATLARLTSEAERRHIRAPIAGRLGEAATLQIGAVVREGDVLGVVLPPGALRVVAAFPPPVALGRLHPGQPARLRLTGFPWTQYGSLAATVTTVAHERRDGQVRVELDLVLDMAFPIQLQHGMPGTVEVEVERVTPATLLLRSIGKRLGLAETTRAGEDSTGEAR
jgi:membrane fusion protein (multidrug efflux system)